MVNRLTLAVAGSRKTQGVVEHCASLPRQRRALVLTFTQANQLELRKRLARYAGDHVGVEVLGWYTFLLRHFAHPFLPFKFPGKRVRGFNFEGRPHRLAKGFSRFFDAQGAAYSCELSHLAYELIAASRGALLRRLQCVSDEVLVDEVQDLSGYDWEIIDMLLGSSLDVRMVGDVRQSVLSTNPRGSKNKRYAYAEAIKWFRERERSGVLEIFDSCTTWRCRPEIAAFSDTIFDASWSFPKTESVNNTVTDHDGVYLVRQEHVGDYVARFRPQCLRDSVRSGTAFDLEYLNFGVAKGAEFERVLIVPTANIAKFVRSGACLEPKVAAKFYVGVTRAVQSVAIALDDPGTSPLPYWTP